MGRGGGFHSPLPSVYQVPLEALGAQSLVLYKEASFFLSVANVYKYFVGGNLRPRREITPRKKWLPPNKIPYNT